MPASRPFEERFWEKVDKRGGLDCWLWTACVNRKGRYGHIRLGRTMVLAHRVAYQLQYGSIDSAIKVLHECDTPLCCNPAHLFLGTQRNNIHDMEAKGRGVHPKGEMGPGAKLTEEKVAEIRRAYVFGSRTHGGPALGRKYEVSAAQICNIVTEKNWK